MTANEMRSAAIMIAASNIDGLTKVGASSSEILSIFEMAVAAVLVSVTIEGGEKEVLSQVIDHMNTHIDRILLARVQPEGTA